MRGFDVAAHRVDVAERRTMLHQQREQHKYRHKRDHIGVQHARFEIAEGVQRFIRFGGLEGISLRQLQKRTLQEELHGNRRNPRREAPAHRHHRDDRTPERTRQQRNKEAQNRAVLAKVQRQEATHCKVCAHAQINGAGNNYQRHAARQQTANGGLTAYVHEIREREKGFEVD